ncbi:hypothetical protein FHS22_003670 [Planomonospora venezuelensis]|uniref:Uncharacterized protein n=1 Tax=Planomonospora venezuelensis TaxID=1999 RepID=A0A841DAI4_PLAVE|nr:hypothetical protein [Planomonospora venezuelensis]
MFSRSGFTGDLEDAAASGRVGLIDLAKLYGAPS